MKRVVLLENVDPDILEGNIWEKGEVKRKYIDLHDILDIKADKYGSGNISNVYFAGEPKSNTWYRKNIQYAKLYIDMNTLELLADDLADDLQELVIEKVEEKVKEQESDKIIIEESDKIIIEALPERFEQLSPKETKELSLQERFDKFRGVIEQSFQPAIDRLAQSITAEFNALASLSKEERDKHQQRMYINLWISENNKEKLSLQWAREQILADIYKTISKLILLDDAEILSYNVQSRILTLKGSIFGSSVQLEQQEVQKQSTKGKWFSQFPARIYLDGKFITESAYHRWFKQKSINTFIDVTDMLEELATENKYPIGTVFYKEGKYKASDAKKGIWPISVYVVVGIKKDHIVVQRVRVKVDTVQGRYPFAHHFQAFYEITDEKIGDTKEWPVKATPTSSKLQEKGVEIAKGRYIQSSPFMKVWNGFKPTIHIPDEGKLLKIDDDNWEFVFDGETYKVKRESYQDWTLKDSIDRLINQLYSSIIRNIRRDPSSFLKKYRSSQK